LHPHPPTFGRYWTVIGGAIAATQNYNVIEFCIALRDRYVAIVAASAASDCTLQAAITVCSKITRNRVSYE